jgi:hypothetical protein
MTFPTLLRRGRGIAFWLRQVQPGRSSPASQVAVGGVDTGRSDEHPLARDTPGLTSAQGLLAPRPLWGYCDVRDHRDAGIARRCFRLAAATKMVDRAGVAVVVAGFGVPRPVLHRWLCSWRRSNCCWPPHCCSTPAAVEEAGPRP